MKTSRTLLSCVLLAAAALEPACGKKGPPLAPLLAVPARISDLTARRIDETVYLKFTIPATNSSGLRPADLARVDVLAFTALSPADVTDVRDMTSVASVTVRRPPEPEPEAEAVEPPTPGAEPEKATPEKKAKPPKPPKPREPGEDQGALFTVTEALTPAMQTLTVAEHKLKPPKLMLWVEPVTKLFDAPVTPPLAGIVPESTPTRFYVAVGVNRKGQRGALSTVVGVRLALAPPAPPAAPVVAVAEKAVSLTWEPPPGAPLPPARTLTTLELIGAATPATASAAGALMAAAAVPSMLPAAAAALATAIADALPPPPAVPPGSGTTPAATVTPVPPAAGGVTAAGAKPPATGSTMAATAAGTTGAAAAGVRPAPVPLTPLAATPRGMHVPVLVGYNVYLSGTLVPPPPPPTPGVAPPAPVPISGGNLAPLPLNAAPLATPAFSDPAFQFGVERCYEVRAVNAVGLPSTHAAPTLPIPGARPAPPPPPSPGPPRPPVITLPPVWFESVASARTCVTPVDTFPPPVPTSLAAVGTAGAINLIWGGVEAVDLAGYIVLRGVVRDGSPTPPAETPMTPLFETPMRESTYRDATVKPGVRYVYTVVSVDTATPANRSLPSNTAEETAR